MNNLPEEMTEMKSWEVTVPIAGHAWLTVAAETEEEAIELAMSEASLNHVQEWDTLRQFVRGNVCCCPSPWEVQAECVGGDEDEDDASAEGSPEAATPVSE